MAKTMPNFSRSVHFMGEGLYFTCDLFFVLLSIA